MRRHHHNPHSGVMAENDMTETETIPPPPPASASPIRWCPDCGTRLAAVRCPGCGLPIGGSAAASYWRLKDRAERISNQRDRALEELRQIGLGDTSPPPPPPPPVASEPTSPWFEGFTVRDFLLGLGVFSLIVAVVSFAVVSWNDLSTGGRVGLVVGVTSLVGASGVALFRHELKATAEAVTVFWAALLVADVAAGRVLLVLDAPPLTVWAAGLAAVAALLAGFGFLTSSRTAPALALIAVVLPLPLLAMGQGSEVLVAGSGLIAFGVAYWASPAIRLRSGPLGAIVAGGLQHLAWAFSAGAALGGLYLNGPVGIILLVAAAAALVTGSYLIDHDGLLLRSQVWMAKGAILTIGVPAVLASRGDDDAWALLASSAVAAVVLAISTRINRRGREGAVLISSGTLVLFALIPVVVLTIRSLITLIEPVSDPWTGSVGGRLRIPEPWRLADQLVALGLLATLAAVSVDQVRSRPHLQWIAGTALGAASIIAVPVIVGMPAWVVIGALLTAGLAGLTTAASTGRIEIGVASTWLIAAGVGASFVTPTLTIGSLAIVGSVCWILGFHAASAGNPTIGAFFVGAAVGVTSGMVLAVAANAGLDDGTIALTVEITAGLLLMPLPVLARLSAAADSRLGKPFTLTPVNAAHEIAGVAVLAIALTATTDTGEAGIITSALIIGAVVSMLHAVRPGRSWLVVAAAALLASATQVQLDGAEIELVEAFVAPWVLAAAVFGWYADRETPTTSSWITWGPPAAVAFGPSLALALGEAPGVRPLILPIVALAVVVLGSVLRKQAPVMIGAIVIALVGLDFLATLASDLPRWIPFTLAGLLLLALGADFERNRDRAQRFALQIKELG